MERGILCCGVLPWKNAARSIPSIDPHKRRLWRSQISVRARRAPSIRAAFDADLTEQISGQGKLQSPFQVALGLGFLVSWDRAVAGALRWSGMPAAAKNLPSASLGMISLVAALLLLDRLAPDACSGVNSFFFPSVEFVQRWMPLFYAPALAMLPAGAKSLQVMDGIKVVLLTVFSWAGTLTVTTLFTTLVRRYAKARLEEAPSGISLAPFSIWEAIPWLAIGAAGFILVYVSPTLLGSPARTLIPFLLSSTVVGFLLGSFLPGPVKRFLHPVITCAIFVNAAALFFSIATEKQFLSVLGSYITNNLKDPGAGDVLLAFVGPLAISYGFLLYRQRRIIVRHGIELASVVSVAGMVSVLITTYAGRALDLSSQLINSVAPSNVTFAFALPVGNLLQANPSLVVSCCVLTGILGANLSRPLLLKATKSDDPVVRGLSAACSSHGYGSASVAAGEPDLLPLCAVAYILMGTFCSLLCSVPALGRIISK
ncbi:plastidal glycolate/glycerate translocator 1, chloroplastic [Selaginella moellendorffii]|nr:plastidal glycolate/glycerate translocator 1, chloroplastic [Selaginella moellendorffii]|eukprot:XP_002960739.2 plastidal glycolate/glycerate translocator 1, chloroplastic [Selaginella moellendorffii]